LYKPFNLQQTQHIWCHQFVAQ